MPAPDIKISGLEKARGALGKSQARLLDQRPLWKRANERVEELAGIQFATGGSLTGGWPPLDEDTLENLRDAGQSTRILVRSGTLMRAATRKSATSALHEQSRTEFRRGVQTGRTDAFYGVIHQTGAGVPQRQFMVWRDTDTRWLLGKAGERIVEPIGR